MLEGFGKVLAFDPEAELDPYDPPLTMRPERWTQVTRLEDVAQADTPCVSVAVDYDQLDDFCGLCLANKKQLDAVALFEFSRAVPGVSPAAIPPNVSTCWRTLHKWDVSLFAEVHRTNEIPKICRRFDHLLAWAIPEDDAEDLADLAGVPQLELAARLNGREYLHNHKDELTWRAPFPPKPPR